MAKWAAAVATGGEMASEHRFIVAGEVRWVQVQTRQLSDASALPQIVGTWPT